MLVDSHCHIDGESYDEDREAVIGRALEAGVIAMLNIGTGDPRSDDFQRAVRLAESYDEIYAAIGVHPHDAKLYDQVAEDNLVALATSSKKVVGWGEIGLDFHYDHSPRATQVAVFRRQIRVARDLGLPIIVHSRSADDETLEVLSEECSHPNFRGGIMHCFGGTAAMAASLIEMGFLISFAGNITFKNAENLRDAARVVPLSHLLVETDCPFLTPVPLRGRRNEPGYVAHTANFLADLLGFFPEELAASTTRNFSRFFNLDHAVFASAEQ